jgi:hypothetical protein
MCSPLSPRPQVGESALLKAGRVAGVNKSGTASPATWKGPMFPRGARWSRAPRLLGVEPGSSAGVEPGSAGVEPGSAGVEPGSAGWSPAPQARGGARPAPQGWTPAPQGWSRARKPRRVGWSPARPRGAGLLPERSGQNFCELRANRALSLPSESTDGRHARRGLSPRGPIHCVG